MVDINDVRHTVQDFQIARQTHNLSDFIHDLQQQRAQNPEETQQYLAACNSVLVQNKILPGLQFEGLTQQGDRAIFKFPNGNELTSGADGIQRRLQAGELLSTTPGTIRVPDAAPPRPTGDSQAGGTTPPGKAGDSDYTVKPGDTLWHISRKHLGPDASESEVYKYVKAIAKANHMDNIGKLIYPDQKLTLPGDGSQTTPTPPPEASTRPPQTRTGDTPTSGQTPPGDSTPPPAVTPPGDSAPPPPQAPPEGSDLVPQTPNSSDSGSERGTEAQAQLEAFARKAAIKELNENMNAIFNVAATLPFEGKLPVGAAATMLSGILGKHLDAQTLAMLQNVETIEKHGNHIEIVQKSDMKFPLKVDEHGAVIDDIKMDRTISFDLSKDAKGHNQFANVKGISIDGHTDIWKPINHNFNAPLESVTINQDASGHTVFDAKIKNPERWYEKMGERVVRGVKRGDSIDASIQLNEDGSVLVSDPNTNLQRRIA